MRHPIAFASSVVAILGSLSSACSKKDPPAESITAVPVVVEGRAIPVRVDAEGFAPSEVQVKKGEKAALVFTRTSDETCATSVVFPDLKIDKQLPKGQPVVVQLPVDEARAYTFQCGMGMYKSKVVVQ